MTRNPTRALARDIRDGLEDAERAAGKAGRQIKDDAAQLASQAAESSKEIAERVVREARRRPRAALAIGALMGAVAGLLLFPRRRRR